jgi:hypothetical protein
MLQYLKSDLLFEKKLKTIKKTPKIEPKCTPCNIITITSGFNFCDKIDILSIYYRIELDDKLINVSLDEKNIRGYKQIKKIKKSTTTELKKDKRKQNKGKSFNNQLSLGFSCNNKVHNHTNPVSIKIFNNGNIQLTGCKDKEEILYIYNYIINNIKKINTNYYFNNKSFKYELVKNLKEIDYIDINYNMITVKIDFNFDFNHYRLYKFFNNYKSNKVTMLYNPNTSTTFQLYFNDKKFLNSNNKKPSCIVFNNSITFIINRYEIIQELFIFIKDIFINNYELIRDFTYILD